MIFKIHLSSATYWKPHLVPPVIASDSKNTQVQERPKNITASTEQIRLLNPQYLQFYKYAIGFEESIKDLSFSASNQSSYTFQMPRQNIWETHSASVAIV